MFEKDKEREGTEHDVFTERTTEPLLNCDGIKTLMKSNRIVAPWMIGHKVNDCDSALHNHL